MCKILKIIFNIKLVIIYSTVVSIPIQKKGPLNSAGLTLDIGL